MINVVLKRILGCGKATPGAIFINGEFICFAIERTDKLYPAGDYKMILGGTGKTMPPQFKGVTYEVVEVEGRTHIKWHVANFWEELEGCTAPNIILTSSPEDVEGQSSRIATRKFMQAMMVEGELVHEAKLKVVEV